MIRKIFIFFCFLFLPCLLLHCSIEYPCPEGEVYTKPYSENNIGSIKRVSYVQEKGLAIFADGAVRDTLSAAAALDTVTGKVLFYNARRLSGNFTLAVDVTENTGTITTITVQYRRSYYQLTNALANVVSDWDELGTITADNAYAEEFDLSADANWLYNTGVQFRFLAASGTYNISLDGKLWIR